MLKAECRRIPLLTLWSYVESLVSCHNDGLGLFFNRLLLAFQPNTQVPNNLKLDYTTYSTPLMPGKVIFKMQSVTENKLPVINDLSYYYY